MTKVKAFLIGLAIPIGTCLIIGLFVLIMPRLAAGRQILFLIFIFLSIFVPPFILGRRDKESRKFIFLGALVFLLLFGGWALQLL